MDSIIKLGAGAVIAYLLLKPKSAVALSTEDCPTCGGAGKTTESYGTNVDASGGSDFICDTCDGSGGVVTKTDTDTGSKEVVAPAIPGLKKRDPKPEVKPLPFQPTIIPRLPVVVPKGKWQDGMAPGTFVDPRTQQTKYVGNVGNKSGGSGPRPTIRTDPGYTSNPSVRHIDPKNPTLSPQVVNFLNQTGMYSSASDKQVALCALKVAADAGDMSAKAHIGVMLAKGDIKQGDLLACDQRPQTSNTGRVPTVVHTYRQFNAPVVVPAEDNSRGTVGGKAVLTASNPRNPVLPGFGRR